MIILKKDHRILGLGSLRTLFSNPDPEIKTIRHPIDKLAATQKGTEIQTFIDSTLRTDQETLGPTDQTTGSKLSITSMLDQRTQILNIVKTFDRTTIYLHPFQFNLLTNRDKM